MLSMRIKNTSKKVWRENKGMGTVEVILIIVVLIGLVVIFKAQITTLVNELFEKITTAAGSI